MRSFRFLAALLAAALLTLGSAQGILNLSVGQDWETLDPAFAAGTPPGRLASRGDDVLNRSDYDSTAVVPSQVEGEAINAAAMVLAFHQHQGVTFHDGVASIAGDV